MPRHNFFVVWVSRAFQGALTFIGYKKPADIIRSVVIWAATVLVLYAAAWSNWPIEVVYSGGGEKIGPGICAVAAIVLIFIVSFAWNLIAQPNRIYNEALDQIEDAERVISGVGDSEADRLFRSEMHKTGFQLYRAELDPHDPASVGRWKAEMDAWVSKVRAHLKERWSVSALHDFESGSVGGFQYPRNAGDTPVGEPETEHVKDKNGFSIFCRYSAYLKSVDDIILHGSYRHLGDVHEILAIRARRNDDGNRGVAT
jgi:hypothetical protein